jgi:hypothetical protein
MRTMRMARLGAIAAVMLAVTMWMAPAWGQSQLFPVPGGVTGSPVGAGDPKMGGDPAGTTLADSSRRRGWRPQSTPRTCARPRPTAIRSSP